MARGNSWSSFSLLWSTSELHTLCTALSHSHCNQDSCTGLCSQPSKASGQFGRGAQVLLALVKLQLSASCLPQQLMASPSSSGWSSPPDRDSLQFQLWIGASFVVLSCGCHSCCNPCGTRAIPEPLKNVEHNAVVPLLGSQLCSVESNQWVQKIHTSHALVVGHDNTGAGHSLFFLHFFVPPWHICCWVGWGECAQEHDTTIVDCHDLSMS